MELQNMDLRGGSLQISTEVLGKIARCAALEGRCRSFLRQPEPESKRLFGACERAVSCYGRNAGWHG